MTVPCRAAVVLRRRAVAAFAVLAALTALGACSSSGDPTTHNDSTHAIVSMTSSNTSTAPTLVSTCPAIVYPAGRLSFGCVRSDLTLTRPNTVWAFNLTRKVEKNWRISEGADVAFPQAHQSLEQIAESYRRLLITRQVYGANPKVLTMASEARILGGAKAYLLESAITISAKLRAGLHLHVRTERLWILALDVGGGNTSAWYVTVPDDLKTLWPKVPALIDGIRVL